MILRKKGLLGFMAALTLSTAAIAEQRTLVINNFAVEPAPKAAWDEMLADFKKANPEIDVVVNPFGVEQYKTAMRNFLSADAPDVFQWNAGNRMAPFVKAGLVMDVSDVWAENGLSDSMASAKASMTIDGKQWGIAFAYYQWGIYYNKDLYKQVGAEIPKTYDEFLANCEKFKAAGIDCLTTGTKALWPAAGIFDYLSLRTNGYEWHMDLTAGKVPYTDQKVRDVFEQFGRLVKPGYITANHAAIDWQDASALLAQGKAANFVMGNFTVPLLKTAGMTNDTLGFFPFPEITPGVPRAEDAPADALFVAAGAKNPADAKKFLAFVAQADTQTKLSKALTQLPINKNAKIDESDPFLKAGFDMLSSAYAIAQFWDRDTEAAMAQAGLEGFQEYMLAPDRLDAILERLESVRKKTYN
jgi:multiple sugar transport system substrate-binding protein